MAVGDLNYFYKRFNEVLSEYDVLDPYEHDEDSPEFETVARKRHALVERLITEIGL